jgi:hypothetical protein
MSDLIAALREAGHEDVAAALEQKELAGRLRKAGREDLADSLITGETPRVEEPEPAAEPTPLAPHEQLAKSLHDAQSRWVTLGSPEGPEEAEAA